MDEEQKGPGLQYIPGEGMPEEEVEEPSFLGATTSVRDVNVLRPYLGRVDARLDEKRRLTIPQNIRALMETRADLLERMLGLEAEEPKEKQEVYIGWNGDGKVLLTDFPVGDAWDKMKNIFYGEINSAGRVIIPREAGPGREVTIEGKRGYLEITLGESKS